MKHILVVLASLLAATVQAELLLGVHSGEPAPTIAQLLAELQPSGETIKVVAFEDVSELTRSLAGGQVDLALLEGTGEDSGEMALVAELYPSVLHILYRNSLPAANLGELLRGRKVWAGSPGGIGHRLVASLALDFGLSPEDYQLLEDPWSIEPDAYFIFGGILTAEAIARLDGFQLFSLGDPANLMRGSVAEGVSLRYPQLRPFILPAQLYPAMSQRAALTLSISTLLVARQDLDTELVYEIARGVEQQAPRIAASYPLAGLPRPPEASDDIGMLPLHEGARRYRDRELPGFLVRYAEVLGLSATLIVAAGSLLLAWRRHREKQRKDRLDTYYQKLLQQRVRLADNPVAAGAGIRATQAEVMQLVIEERIDADGALLAFLSLSNRLLTEADSLAGGGSVHTS